MPGSTDVSQGALRELSAERIVRYLADAAARWRDPDFPPRVRACGAIEARLGYSGPVVDYALDRLFGAVSRDALTAAIASELGDLDALDGVVPRRGAPAAWARGVDRVTIVASDTTIGVAIIPAIFALCAKCDVTVKDRSDLLVASFFATLAEEHAAFASAARARAWTGGDDADESALLAAADVVVAFGGEEALRAIRSRCAGEARFIAFGHRASVGLLRAADVAALDARVADGIARDALLYDGEGCLSLQVLFVEAGGESLNRVASFLASACERVAREFPAGAQPARRVAAASAYRNRASFRAAGGCGAVLRAGDATLVVASRGEPPPLLPRILPLVPVGGDDDVAGYVRDHRLPVQALGAVAHDADTASLAARIGAVRVAPFGALQDPPLGGHHGGAPRIADFVRWIDGA